MVNRRKSYLGISILLFTLFILFEIAGCMVPLFKGDKEARTESNEIESTANLRDGKIGQEF